MLDVITRTLPIFIAIALGKFFTHRKLLPKSAANTVSTITFTIIGPFFIFNALCGVTLSTQSIHLLVSPLVIFTSILLLSYLFGRFALRLEQKQLGAMVLCLTTFGAGAMYPFVARNFPETTFKDFIVIDLLSFLTFLTIGSVVARYLGKRSGQGIRDTVVGLFKDPLVLTILFTFLLSASGIKVPKFVTETAQFFGGSFFLMCSLFVGMSLELPDRKALGRLVSIHLFRVVVVILLVIAIAKVFGLNRVDTIPLLLVFLTQYSVLAVMFSKEQGLDHEFASQLVLFGMVSQLVLYPIVIMLLQ